MRKTGFFSILIASLLISGCSKNKDKPAEDSTPSPEPTPANYIDKDVNIYRKEGEVDKQMSLRFYNDLPNVPYVSPTAYIKEFFNTEIEGKKDGHSFKYEKAEGTYISFNTKDGLLFAKHLHSFDSHPDSIQSSSTIFLQYDGSVQTSESEKVISLKKYSINLYEDENNAYVPFTLLSKLMGGSQLYQVSYNEKDIYVLDFQGMLGNATRAATFSEYFSVLDDASTTRPEDLAEYTYNELCFVFDNLRGYTSQLIFGDNNLLTLGLNGILELYYPKVKEFILSTDRLNYYEGLAAVFDGLYDGGHTTIVERPSVYTSAKGRQDDEQFRSLSVTALNEQLRKVLKRSGVNNSKSSKLSISDSNYYYFDIDTKTAYVGFGSFDVDYSGWDDYYNNNGEIPVSTDTYAFVRSKLYQALDDEAENVVLDLAYNGGGSSYALEGIVGLLNEGKAEFNYNNTFNNYRVTDKHSVDINLDGEYNEADKVEADKFKALNIGILTSEYSFSCGNLLPSVLKGLGYKIIGEKSGGGSCAIALATTADGLVYAHSTYICLSDQAGNNIDAGVPVDFEIEPTKIENPYYTTYKYDDFYNFTLVSDYLSTAYN